MSSQLLLQPSREANKAIYFIFWMKVDTKICLNCQKVEIHEDAEFHFMLLTWSDQTDDDN